MRQIDKIIVHCADTPDEGDKFGFKEIDQWHRDKGWLDKSSGISCGYHAIVRSSGVVELGRPESSIGSHVADHNSNSLGICLIGRERVTVKQLLAAIEICFRWCRRYILTQDNVYGHYEFNAGKKCPGQDMDSFRTLLSHKLFCKDP